MKKKFISSLVAILLLLAIPLLTGCDQPIAGPVAGPSVGAVPAYASVAFLATPNVTGTLYGKGSNNITGVNIQGVVYANNGSAPTVANNTQIMTVLHMASGNATLSSGTVNVTHGLGAIPTWITISSMSVMGGNYSVYTTTVNSTMFTVVSTNASATYVIGWIAGY